MLVRLFIRSISWAALLFLLVPLIVIIGASLTAGSVLEFPPKEYSFRWYEIMLADKSYMEAFITSSLLALVATVVSVLMAVPLALLISKCDFKGKSVLASTLMSPLVLPHIVLGAALLQFGASFGLVRSFEALLVGHTIIIMPFVLRSLLAVMTEEQMVLEDASMDLGASPLTTFWLVTLPQIRSGLITGSIFAFISSWINVELSIFNTTSTLNTIPVKLFNYVQYTIDPTIAAVSAITIIVAALVIILLDVFIGLNLLNSEEK